MRREKGKPCDTSLPPPSPPPTHHYLFSPRVNRPSGQLGGRERAPCSACRQHPVVVGEGGRKVEKGKSDVCLSASHQGSFSGIKQLVVLFLFYTVCVHIYGLIPNRAVFSIQFHWQPSPIKVCSWLSNAIKKFCGFLLFFFYAHAKENIWISIRDKLTFDNQTDSILQPTFCRLAMHFAMKVIRTFICSGRVLRPEQINVLRKFSQNGSRHGMAWALGDFLHTCPPCTQMLIAPFMLFPSPPFPPAVPQLYSLHPLHLFFLPSLRPPFQH